MDFEGRWDGQRVEVKTGKHSRQAGMVIDVDVNGNGDEMMGGLPLVLSSIPLA